VLQDTSVSEDLAASIFKSGKSWVNAVPLLLLSMVCVWVNYGLESFGIKITLNICYVPTQKSSTSLTNRGQLFLGVAHKARFPVDKIS
jgi:hypothetical protein